jgi:hypothetical protein
MSAPDRTRRPTRRADALGAVALAMLAGCGGKSELLDSDPFADDAGLDAGADARTDGDATLDGPKPKDAAADGDGAAEPSLGDACDGQGGDPSGCSAGLSCYTGGGDPNQQGRWPGGYCTRSCQSDGDCAAYGGVCGGNELGQGRCFVKCTEPVECRDGYACRSVGYATKKLACAPTGFIATRGPGVACFQHEDPTAPHYVPAPARVHFQEIQQVDQTFYGSDEVALTVDDSADVIVGMNAFSQQGNVNPAFTGAGTSLPIDFTQNDGPTDPNAAFYSDPYLVHGKDGTIYYSTIALDAQVKNAWIVVARSSDHGSTWQSVEVNPPSDCTSGLSGQNQGPCMDHPWLAIGPDKLDPSSEALYAAYLATTANDYPTVLIRSTDGGKTWGIPGSPGHSLPVFSPNQNGAFYNLITPAVADDGTVHVVALGVGGDEHGSTQNGVYYSRSDDGGKTRTEPKIISAVGKPVPFEQPVVATDGTSVYVVYVAGSIKGDWDVMLASSTDGGASWAREKVNDEPEACATHFHPTLAIDPTTHAVYVAWYDGRFAPYEGLVAFSICDFSKPGPSHCSPNEAINDQPFFVTTDRNGLSFLGDYFTLVAKPGGVVWAGFGDPVVDDVTRAFVARGVVN